LSNLDISAPTSARSLIIGSHGQDGSYLSENLHAHGHDVYGLSHDALEHGDETFPAVDLGKPGDVGRLIEDLHPDQVFFLVAYHQSAEDVPDAPGVVLEHSLETNTRYFINVAEALRDHWPQGRLFYAASSHIFGMPNEVPQNETTAINPIDAYGISKATGVFICRHYRERHGLFASAGILYNHESPRRLPTFAVRKIVCAAIRIQMGEAKELVVGDLGATVDWGYAPDYVDAMRLILELDQPDDFIVATGAAHSIQALIEIVFEELDLPAATPVRENPGLLTKHNPSNPLIGDAGKLTAMTGWRPRTDLRGIISSIIDAERAAHEC
jgi:GDPmannose 4,6-dehydratase